MENEENNKLLVVKSNYLVEASYRLTITEQKIMYMIISQINKSDTNFKDYTFSVAEFIKIIGLKGKSAYNELKSTIRLLRSRTFTVKYSMNGKNKELITGWIVNAEYEEGLLKFNIDPKLKPFLVQLKREFTAMSLNNLMQLKSTYSPRIYELLKQYLKIGERTFDFEELKDILAIGEGEYKLYSHFKSRVILKAQSELKEKTDINFEFEEIKTGRKVTSLKFYIKPNKKVTAPKENRAIDEIVADVETPLDIIEHDIKQIMDITNHEFNENTVTTFRNLANGDIDKIKRVYEYVNTREIKGSKAGYMRTSLENWEEPKQSSATTGFNNFEPRSYDYDSLEKKLLGWDND